MVYYGAEEGIPVAEPEEIDDDSGEISLEEELVEEVEEVDDEIDDEEKEDEVELSRGKF